jgi:hypothetical protein
MVIVAPQPAPAAPTKDRCPAQALDSGQRHQLARAVLAGQPRSQLAREHQVSRKFVAQQVDKAEQALAEAFVPEPSTEGAVLFYLPVTEAWLRRLILALLLLCHSSYRGV